uniref:Dual specificity phosphatase 22b n=1 Tax=Oncorhynchus kisutch TaxID=8019 RepID=A0A8C7HWN1_ONCKI
MNVNKRSHINILCLPSHRSCLTCTWETSKVCVSSPHSTGQRLEPKDKTSVLRHCFPLPVHFSGTFILRTFYEYFKIRINISSLSFDTFFPLTDARDREQLTRNNITHILSIHDSAAPILPGMTYLCISAADLPTQNLRMHFKQSIMFIHESRLKGEGCLVHCLAGVSRSVTLVVAYIMTVTGLGWQEALAAVRVARPCAGPNLGFQRQLQEFETNHADQYREWLWQLYKERPFNDEDDIRILLAKSFKSNGVGVEVNVEPSTPPGLQGT